MKERSLDRLVEDMRKAKDTGGCALFLGAGCSWSAGIPLAGEFVDHIKKEHPGAHRDAKDHSYAACMAELSPGQRHDLISRFVDAAKINWAHVAIAQLIKNRYVDRILTTNFDPLVSRACAVVGVFPAIYDIAILTGYQRQYIPGIAVFHLHGQRQGFVLKNTDPEMEQHLAAIQPIINDAISGRLIVVAGYSGGDPSFKALASHPSFDRGLYWVSHEGKLGDNVRKFLGKTNRYAFHIRSAGADDFFVALAQRLGCFPPDLIARPFSHLDSQFDHFSDFRLPGQAQPYEVLETARSWISDAISQFEGPPRTDREQQRTSKSVAVEAEAALLAGNYAKVVDLLTSIASPNGPAKEREILALALVFQGLALVDQAKTKSGDEAGQLLRGDHAQ